MFKRLCTITAAALLTVASYAAAVEMREGHPSSYTVVRGDTLWDIAGRFLTKPWLWPEIWQANPQIENPHRIYPGDVISLAYLDGKPVLQVQTAQAGPRGAAESAISTIPLAEIAPFLRQSTIVSDLDDLPYVVSIEEERMRGVVGQVVYVRNLDSAKVGDTITIARPSHHFRLPAERQRNNVIPSSLDHRGNETYTDWRSFWATTISRDGESLGYELTTQGSARITQVQGEVAIALLVDGTAEVRAGDRVLPFESNPYDDSYLPQAPASIPETAAVLAVADASFAAGPRSVVALAVGSSDGVKNGTVFSTWRPGNAVVDDVAHSNFYRAQADKVQLPDEFTGRVLVFRTFERVSYGLVMEGIRPVQVGDRLKHPDAAQ